MSSNYYHFLSSYIQKINIKDKMKRILLLIIVHFSCHVFTQHPLPFKNGEYAEYTIYFGPLQVGHAKMEIVDLVGINNKTTFHILGKGRTAYFFDLFFKVRDTYETYIDTTTLLPVKFHRDVYEGGHQINQEYTFFHDNQLVRAKTQVIKHKKKKTQNNDSIYSLSLNSQDMLSALFYARTFDKYALTQKDTFFIPIFMDEEMYNLEIIYLYNEIIETKWGKIECMVFKPKMQEGRVFEDGEQMKIWISNDNNNLLLKVETKIWAGTIKAIIVDYKSIKYPLHILSEN